MMNMSESRKKRLIIGICGASGVILAIKLLQFLKECNYVETHVVVSESGLKTISLETNYNVGDIKKLSDYFYQNDKIEAGISSGTFKCEGMIIVPCSMKTLSSVTYGYTDNLLQRAADVCLKERRKLVLVVRESPLSIIHLKNMLASAVAGAIIMPPVPAFYTKPKNIDEIINQIVGRILDKFDIESENFKRWIN